MVFERALALRELLECHALVAVELQHGFAVYVVHEGAARFERRHDVIVGLFHLGLDLISLSSCLRDGTG